MTAEERAQIEALGHFKLPSEATNLRYHIERGQDAAIWLRMDIPRSEREAFLRSAGHTTLSGTRRPLRNYLRKDLAWWTPDAVSPFEGGEYQSETGKRYASHVLLSSGDPCTVFLFVTSL
jgi:hypothetical protein